MVFSPKLKNYLSEKEIDGREMEKEKGVGEDENMDNNCTKRTLCIIHRHCNLDTVIMN